MSDQGVQTALTTDEAVAQQQAPAAAPAPAPQAEAAPPLGTEGYEALKAESAGTERTFPVRDQNFRVVPELPGIVLLDLGVAADPSATPAEQLRAVREFLNAAIVEEDRPAFERLLRTAQPIIKIDELNKVVEGLIEMVGGRPTE